MGLFGWILYFVLGIILFFSIRFLDIYYKIKKNEKFIFSIIIWLVFCGVCFHFAIPYTGDIFLVFVCLMIIDIMYCSYFLDRDFFDSGDKNIIYYVLLVLTGFFLNQEFINKVSQVFLTGEELRGVLWFLILLFLYRFGKSKDIFSSTSTLEKQIMSPENVLIQYTKLRYRYKCMFKTKELSSLMYSIMIYENQKRSRLFRIYDYFMFRLTGSSRKLGIMQVDSDRFITDLESIDIVYQKLEKEYSNSASRGNKRIESIIKNYYEESFDTVKYLFDIIQKF